MPWHGRRPPVLATGTGPDTKGQNLICILWLIQMSHGIPNLSLLMQGCDQQFEGYIQPCYWELLTHTTRAGMPLRSIFVPSATADNLSHIPWVRWTSIHVC